MTVFQASRCRGPSMKHQSLNYNHVRLRPGVVQRKYLSPSDETRGSLMVLSFMLNMCTNTYSCYGICVS